MTAATAEGLARKVSMKRPSDNVEFSRLSGTKLEPPLLSWSFQLSPNFKREPAEGSTGVLREAADGTGADKNLGKVAYDEEVLGGLLEAGLRGERGERRGRCWIPADSAIVTGDGG